MVSKNNSEMRRATRARKFKKESSIYGIPVKNTGKIDMS
jgi:hypothetical protein